MRKVSFYVAALVLLAAAIPLGAETTFKFSGELTYGVITDFTQSNPAYGNAFLTFNAKVDPNNNIYATLATALQGASQSVLTSLSGTTATFNAFTTYMSDFHGVSDVGAVLGWKANGFDPVVYFGWTDLTAVTHGVSGYGYEAVAAFDPGTSDTFAIDFNFGSFATLRFDTNPRSPTTVANHFLTDLYGTAGPLSWSAVYWTNNRTDMTGLLGGDLGYNLTVGGVGLGLNAQAKYDFANANGWGYGVGMKATWATILTLGLGFAGSSTGLGNFGLNANVVPIAGLGVDLGTSFALGAGALNGIDISAWKTFGAGKLRLGYLFTTTNSGLLYGPASLPNGGAYASFDITY